MKYVIALIFSLSSTALLAQAGPGGLPSPEIPVDGGITAFLVAAGLAGAGLLGWKKRRI